MIISGKNINLRLVDVGDAEFIYKLRMDEKKNKYISPVKADLKDQVDWLISYKEREKLKLEYYFIVYSKSSESLGLVRLYDFQGLSFCWGSWIMKEGAPRAAAIESALLVYELGFNKLNFESARFDVHKDNPSVYKFNNRLGAELNSTEGERYYFQLSKQSYLNTRERYAKFTGSFF
jgi:hypothetical protein